MVHFSETFLSKMFVERKRLRVFAQVTYNKSEAQE